MKVVSPKKIWTSESAPKPQAVVVGALVQVFIKRENISGFDSVFARVTKTAGMKCEAVIVDGPSGTAQITIKFDTGDVFDVL